MCFLIRIGQIFYCKKNTLNWISLAGGDFVGCPFFHLKNLNPSRLHVYHNCLAGYEHRSNQPSDLHLELVDAYSAITEFFCVGNQANKPQKMLFSRLGTNTTVLDKVASLEMRSSANPRAGEIGNQHAPCYKCGPIKLFQPSKKTSQVPFKQ